MQLTKVLLHCAVLASFVVASPFEALTTPDAKREAYGDPGIKGRNSMTGVSKRTNSNVLDKRDGAVLWGYVDSDCNGIYYEYSLDNLPAWSCWETISFNSAYVPSPDGSGLPYNVYVGASCSTGSHFPCIFPSLKSDLCIQPLPFLLSIPATMLIPLASCTTLTKLVCQPYRGSRPSDKCPRLLDLLMMLHDLRCPYTS